MLSTLGKGLVDTRLHKCLEARMRGELSGQFIE
jgi:hypothetical protein